MGLTSAEGQKLECLNEQQIKFSKSHENLVNPLWSKVMLVFYLTLAFYVYMTISVLQTSRI